MPHRLYPQVADRAGHQCEYCLAPEEVFNNPFEVEHIVPLSRGGADTFDNLALACRACNSRKGQLLDGPDPDTGIRVALFHPRSEPWDQHFELNAATGQINGLTALGRATIAALGMNTSQAVRARRIWVQWLLL